MTGFRVHRGGAQALYGVRPDLTCLGKIIGGGLPVGAYGGREDLMSLVAPAGPMYQAGTLSGNPLAVTAGLWSTRALTATLYRTLDRLTKRLGDGLLDAAKRAGVPLQVNRVGSMITPFFTATSRHRLRVGDEVGHRARSAASTARCWRRASTCRRRSTKRGSCRRRTPSATSIARSRPRAPPSPISADAPRRLAVAQALRDTMRTATSRAVVNPMRS